jgi:hypothetical protein
VSRNQWVRYTREPALLQVNIRPANFRDLDFEKRGVWFEIGFGDFTNFDRCMGLGNDGDEWHVLFILKIM